MTSTDREAKSEEKCTSQSSKTVHNLSFVTKLSKLITKITNFNKYVAYSITSTSKLPQYNYNPSISKWKTKYNGNKLFSDVTFGKQTLYESSSSILDGSNDF